ncbi:MAG TPA: matrixin family metalloprotease [Thermoanaerobaculia bacterium]|nr:matrixin family metalloprotease [Thermoanaerobaculia bacterium]
MFPRIAAALLALTLAAPAFTATRLTYDIQGVPTALEWAPTSFPLPYEVDRRLANLRPDAEAAVDKAFGTWSSVQDTNVRFERRGVTDEVSDHSAGRVVVSLADDLFKGQGALAMTTYTFDKTSGNLTDADILIDPSLLSGRYNLQMALQHEIGHVLGLDHSGVISAVMYPFVSNGDSPASFDSDDRIAIATSYPIDDPTLRGATLSGRVVGDSGAIFGAQVVAVNEQGQPVATVLTTASGEFSVSGIPAGRYRIYAEPLDGPVDPAALRGTWRGANAVSFPTQFFGDTPIAVENGKVYGNLVVNATGPTRLNPKWVGTCAPSSPNMSLASTPSVVQPGQTVKISIGGDGFTSGMTEFEVLNPSFRRVSNFDWSSNYVSANFEIGADAAVGSAVVLVTSGNETATLTGALKIHRQAKGRAARH